MKRFLLQTAANDLKFELVDQHIFDNRKFAIDGDGNPRYSENYAVSEGNRVEIHFEGNSQCLGGIARMLNVSGNLGQADEPTHVRFARGRSVWIYEVETGERWKRSSGQKAA
jgi:hypothetical protein